MNFASSILKKWCQKYLQIKLLQRVISLSFPALVYAKFKVRSALCTAYPGEVAFAALSGRGPSFWRKIIENWFLRKDSFCSTFARFLFLDTCAQFLVVCFAGYFANKKGFEEKGLKIEKAWFHRLEWIRTTRFKWIIRNKVGQCISDQCSCVWIYRTLGFVNNRRICKQLHIWATINLLIPVFILEPIVGGSIVGVWVVYWRISHQ